MERCYLKLDEQLDQLIGVEWSAPASRREAMHDRLTKGWVYHELAVEGFGMEAESLDRALNGEVGGNHMERTAFERARRFRAAYQRMREVGSSAEPLNRGQALAYLGWLTGRVEAGSMRKEPGATEQFKHEVVAPEQIDKALGMMFAEADLMSSRLHPIDLAVQVHHRFVKIWPFEKHSAGERVPCRHHPELRAAALLSLAPLRCFAVARAVRRRAGGAGADPVSRTFTPSRICSRVRCIEVAGA